MIEPFVIWDEEDALKMGLHEFATRFQFCWACGVGAGVAAANGIDYPRWLEIHHIGKLHRLHNRWNLSRLCKLCHDLAEGIRVRHDGELLPKLRPLNVVWLKQVFDRPHFSRAELQRVWRGNLLSAQRPPEFYEDLHQVNRGVAWPSKLRRVSHG